MSKKLIPLLVMTTMLGIGSSLIAQQNDQQEPPVSQPADATTEALPPVELTISRHDITTVDYPRPLRKVSLQKGQELILKINNPDNVKQPELVFSNGDIGIPDFKKKHIIATKIADQEKFLKYKYGADGLLDPIYDWWSWYTDPTDYTDNTSSFLAREETLNTDGDPLTYHFKAKGVSGKVRIHFFLDPYSYYKNIYNKSPVTIEVTVENEKFPPVEQTISPNIFGHTTPMEVNLKKAQEFILHVDTLKGAWHNADLSSYNSPEDPDHDHAISTEVWGYFSGGYTNEPDYYASDILQKETEFSTEDEASLTYHFRAQQIIGKAHIYFRSQYWYPGWGFSYKRFYIDVNIKENDATGS